MKQDTKTALWALVALVAMFLVAVNPPRLVEAQTPNRARMYSSGSAGISVTATNTAITFTDNRSGGDSGSFSARSFTISSRSGSADACFFDWLDTTATTADARLEPGGSFTITVPDNYTPGTGYAGLGAICDTGDTATFDIVAHK